MFFFILFLSSSFVSSLSCGMYTCCSIQFDKTVFCWGYNRNGQVGNNQTQNPFVSPHGQTVPTQMLAISNASAVCTGFDFTCVLDSSTVKCAGSNAMGQLGIAAPSVDANIVVSSNLPNNIVSISCGYSTACAVDVLGNSYCWGRGAGSPNRLANSLSNHEFSAFGGLPGSPTTTQISTSMGVDTSHTCFLIPSGGIICIGDNLNSLFLSSYFNLMYQRSMW